VPVALVLVRQSNRVRAPERRPTLVPMQTVAAAPLLVVVRPRTRTQTQWRTMMLLMLLLMRGLRGQGLILSKKMPRLGRLSRSLARSFLRR